MKKITFILVYTLFVFSALAEENLKSGFPNESDYYPITTIPLPEGEYIEVSGIDILPDNQIAIASRRGDIFVGKKVGGKNPQPHWTLYARGLHEVLGISWKDGCLYATQRPEVTRMKDRDGDGRPDRDLEAGAADDDEEKQRPASLTEGLCLVVFASLWMAVGLHSVTAVTTDQKHYMPASYYMQLFFGVATICLALFLYAGAAVKVFQSCSKSISMSNLFKRSKMREDF